VRKFFIGLQ